MNTLHKKFIAVLFCLLPLQSMADFASYFNSASSAARNYFNSAVSLAKENKVAAASIGVATLASTLATYYGLQLRAEKRRSKKALDDQNRLLDDQNRLNKTLRFAWDSEKQAGIDNAKKHAETTFKLRTEIAQRDAIIITHQVQDQAYKDKVQSLLAQRDAEIKKLQGDQSKYLDHKHSPSSSLSSVALAKGDSSSSSSSNNTTSASSDISDSGCAYDQVSLARSVTNKTKDIAHEVADQALGTAALHTTAGAALATGICDAGSSALSDVVITQAPAYAAAVQGVCDAGAHVVNGATNVAKAAAYTTYLGIRVSLIAAKACGKEVVSTCIDAIKNPIQTGKIAYTDYVKPAWFGLGRFVKTTTSFSNLRAKLTGFFSKAKQSETAANKTSASASSTSASLSSSTLDTKHTPTSVDKTPSKAADLAFAPALVVASSSAAETPLLLSPASSATAMPVNFSDETRTSEPLPANHSPKADVTYDQTNSNTAVASPTTPSTRQQRRGNRSRMKSRGGSLRRPISQTTLASPEKAGN